jgi:hypothetical protein
MDPINPKISKLAVTGTWHITLTIPETLQIIRKPGSAISQCHYGIIQHWIVDHLWYKKHKEKLPVTS